MFHWLLNVFFGVKVGFCSCAPEVRRLGVARVRSQYQIERLARLPRVVNESSGLARRTADGRTIWTHNDGGGRPTLYGVDVATGTLLDSLPFPSLRNTDWEELTQADTSRLFIADLGNNANTRRDLAIHQVDRAGNHTATLAISYADQLAFPPDRATKPGRNFDCEAVFYRTDSLFLLSKNRSGHQVRLYGVPARAGTYQLAPLDSVFIKSMVTGAAISPATDGRAGQTLAVLTYGKILFFDLGTSGRLGRPTGCLRLPRSQTEAIVFLNDTDLLISNERGWLYRLRRR
ncbi:hypothetical protein FAES_0961 [Fibrella aestuarina BUZ 2]|uniref:Uncharacterized protein n=1 Tax=Fibrella aestuarina BUZ 2 TaxID=1166018 RepID=I0K4B9_9BACT|nr:hypothetical protein [Fibrella aestuarina]CCG98972.1 hypothetical protein FAES_0961 [Fibrella aestuarina BUZ 2]